MSARTGLLGGTFNPPHVAHLRAAIEAREQLGLDGVTLVPAAVPPHKVPEDDPGAEARFELCRLAVADTEGLDVSRVELDRLGPSYTADTLRALHDAMPGVQLTFIVGGDMARSLPSWREPDVVLALARLAVFERAADGREQVLAALQSLPGAAERVDFVAMPRLDVSSSMIRDRLAGGRSIRHLVPDAVADRVQTLGLYQAGVSA